VYSSDTEEAVACI